MAEKNQKKAKKIFVCSPYGGKLGNIRRAAIICKYILQDGNIPFAPHVFFPQFLDEKDDLQRAAGINAGIVFMESFADRDAL